MHPAAWIPRRWHPTQWVAAAALAAAVRAGAAPFATGADASWYTQMVHDSGYVFRTQAGEALPCLSVLQSVGINAVRLRVWMNPAGGWCGQADVVSKALAANALGQSVMLDFHFSDTWASGDTQAPPAAWASYGLDQMEAAVSTEVSSVLGAIQAAGGTVSWVQLGNEINDGMLFPVGEVNGKGANSYANLAGLINAGYSAVKAVFPGALVVIHLSGGDNDAYFRQFFDALRAAGGRFDAIGMSAYPVYSGLTWQDEVTAVTATLKDMPARYGVPALVCECGYAESDATDAGSYLQALLAAARSAGALGVFYWEPECYGNWPVGSPYGLGAFTSQGEPSGAMSAFAASGVAPYFAPAPASLSVASGASVVLAAGASGFPAPTYQWSFNGVTLGGADGPLLMIHDVSTGQAGSYTCTASNASGTTVGPPVALAVVSTQDPGRLINLSCLSTAGVGAATLTAGFVIGGAGTSGVLPVLIRASGPALAQFGLSGLLADPQLILTNTSASPNIQIGKDTGWGGGAALAQEMKAVGAFSWGSAPTPDSAVAETLAAGSYTAEAVGASGDTGEALVEAYDASGTGYTPASPRLINLSVRTTVASGSTPLTVGFVIGGSTAETVLVRAGGPALAQFGLTGLLSDPLLVLVNTTGGADTILATDAGWGASPVIADAASYVGAYGWGSSATADSAILVTLPPGNYTAQVVGESGDSGVALIEVYEVP